MTDRLLHRFVKSDDLEKTQDLLRCGFDVNQRDENSRIALHIAADGGRTKAARLLIGSGSELDARDKLDRTPLHYAALHGDIEMAELLLANRAGVDCQASPDMVTPLHLAVERGYLQLIRLLLDGGADPNVSTSQGMSCAHTAIMADQLGALEILLDNETLHADPQKPARRRKQADPNAKEINGATPLHGAVFHGMRDAVRLLVAHGADAGVPDNEGLSPFDLAREAGSMELLDLLTAKTAVSASKRCQQGQTDRTLSDALAPEILEPNQIITISEFESYQIEDVLGVGGQGAVYLVRSLQFGDKRYALKRAHYTDDVHRRLLVRELAVWLGLDEHPNLMSCRFFRTVEKEELLIFTDHAEHGSLADWIHGGLLPTVDVILDVAIQAAWGLHAAHELGVIHRDVKPGNMLVHSNNVVKVSDFGISGRTPLVGPSGASGGALAVTSFAGTRLYRSPEQLPGGTVDRRSDLWGWAATVVEMFFGKIIWEDGIEAGAKLPEHLRNNKAQRVPMPPPVAALLMECFRKEPNRRPPSLLVAARMLVDAYGGEIGSPYPRREPAFPRIASGFTHDRRIEAGVQWQDPRALAEEYARRIGEDFDAIRRQLPADGGTRRGQAACDLAWFDESLRLMERIPAMLPLERHRIRSEILMHKAFVHEHLADLSGAIACYRETIAIRGRLQREGFEAIEQPLAVAWGNLGLVLQKQNRFDSALEAHRQAIQILNGAVKAWRHYGLLIDLANQRMLAANALDEQHFVEEAISEYDSAVNLLESIEFGDGLADNLYLEAKRDLATARVNRGIALNKIKRWKEAIDDFDKAIEFRKAMTAAGNQEFLESLASAHMHMGSVLTECRDFEAAVFNYGQAIQIFSDLVYQQHKHECTAGLANVYANRALAFRRRGDADRALLDLRNAATLYRKLLYDQGVIEVADALAETLMIAGNALSDLGRSEEALEEYDKAIEIREELVWVHRREEILRGLAMAKSNRGTALTRCGRITEAINEFDEAIEIYERPTFRHLEEELAVIRHAKAAAMLRGLSAF